MREDEEQTKAGFTPEVVAASSSSTNKQLREVEAKLDDNFNEEKGAQAEAGGQQNGPAAAAEKKPNWFLDPIRTQIKTFNPLLLILGIKGALPPAIFLAMYRSTAVADNIGSLGYLAAMIAALSFAMLPRSKFIQLLLRNMFFACLGCPFAILGLWAARQARNHTQPPGDNGQYNSSAAAVSAIFLFVNVFIGNAFRARYPTLMLPVVMYSIMTNVSLTLGYLLPDVLPVYYIPKRLMINFCIGWALALVVNLIIVPVNSRQIFLRSFEAYLNSAINLLKAHDSYLTPPKNYLSPAQEATLKKAKAAYRQSFIKLAADKTDAKREIAFGALTASHLSTFNKLARALAWPLVGLGTIASIVGEMLNAPEELKNAADKGTLGADDVHRAITVLDRPCTVLNELCQEGIEHVKATLQMGKYAKPSFLSRLFGKKKAKEGDAESASDLGTAAFITRFDEGVALFRSQRGENLAQFYDEAQVTPTQGLFLVLSVGFLLLAVAQEIRALIVFVDQLRDSGELTKKRFIVPKVKVIRKAFEKLFERGGNAEDVGGDGYGAEDGDIYTKHYTGRVNQSAIAPVTTNKFLKFLFACILSVPRFFKSPYAGFGVRAACATFAGTIPAFLGPSYYFFTEYRGVWITITVILGMSPTTGASIYGLLTRCLGTIIGGLLAMMVWYIVDQKVPGIIVMTWFVIIFHYYFFLQDPRRIRSILNSLTTLLLIVGYALEVSKIGLATIESTGQTYFPIYELAPFRILVTLIGVVLAFIFTMFPYPTTSRDILRQDLAREFHLLGTMYTLTQHRMGILVQSDGTHEYATLKKLLQKTAFKIIAVQARCAENLSYTGWEPSLSYVFPQKTYAELLAAMSSLFELFVIQNDAITRLEGRWLHDVITSLGASFFQTQRQLALNILNILAGSLSLDTPLPPFLEVPRAVSFRLLLQEKMPGELALEHVGENGYSVFAALAVSFRLASRELRKCVEVVRALEGEVDLQWELDDEDFKKDV